MIFSAFYWFERRDFLIFELGTEALNVAEHYQCTNDGRGGLDTFKVFSGGFI